MSRHDDEGGAGPTGGPRRSDSGFQEPFRASCAGSARRRPVSGSERRLATGVPDTIAAAIRDGVSPGNACFRSPSRRAPRRSRRCRCADRPAPRPDARATDTSGSRRPRLPLGSALIGGGRRRRAVHTVRLSVGFPPRAHQAELEHLDVPFVGHEDVRRLDVSVHQPAPVHGGDAVDQLNREIQHAVRTQCAGGEHGVQRRVLRAARRPGTRARFPRPNREPRRCEGD